LRYWNSAVPYHHEAAVGGRVQIDGVDEEVGVCAQLKFGTDAYRGGSCRGQAVSLAGEHGAEGNPRP
jgi:hypothetical protein